MFFLFLSPAKVDSLEMPNMLRDPACHPGLPRSPRKLPDSRRSVTRHKLEPVLRHAGQRAVLRVPVVEEKEAGERRLRLARQQLAQQADQLRAALLLGGSPRYAGNLEGVRLQRSTSSWWPLHWRPCQSPCARCSWGCSYAASQQDVAPRGRQTSASCSWSPSAGRAQSACVSAGSRSGKRKVQPSI